MTPRPNVIVILADDLGYSDLGCFGGEIATPNIDRIGREGVRFTHFYNTARCSPSRASLLTGRHPHETGIGILTDDDRPHGYPGSLDPRFPTLAQRFSEAGYATALSGKWHLSSNVSEPDDSWPTRRGFDEFFGIMPGAGDYYHPAGLWYGEEKQPVPDDPGFYLTDAIAEHAAGFVTAHAGTTPFFLYLAFTAPHWPLQAPEADIERYDGVFDEGWDVLRRRRLERLVAEGLLPAGTELSERDPTQPAWADVENPTWESRRMAVYAAQVEIMDRGVGRVLDALENAGASDDTVILFLSDNGACAEELPPPDAIHFRERQPTHTPAGIPLQLGNEPSIVPGPDTTFASYGRAWANLGNTPFRLYKRWVHEGGIATPLLLRWPRGLDAGRVVHEPYQLTDIAPTLFEAAGVEPLHGPGTSVLPVARGERAHDQHTLVWEHVGNAAIRRGRWKL
ncbi:MAG: arylsulfatase, partial [Thermoleophilia bacterium]|nr:arylsulfatase [Thermoleophilia bacterium]